VISGKPDDQQRRDETKNPAMAEIKWKAEAEQWLRDIFAYIAADKPEAARRVVKKPSGPLPTAFSEPHHH
jgi:hypothetical protein